MQPCACSPAQLSHSLHSMSPCFLRHLTPSSSLASPRPMQGIIYIVIAAPFLLNGGAGMKVYRRIGRALSRRAVSGIGAEESGADFFFGAWATGCVHS